MGANRFGVFAVITVMFCVVLECLQHVSTCLASFATLLELIMCTWHHKTMISPPNLSQPAHSARGHAQRRRWRTRDLRRRASARQAAIIAKALPRGLEASRPRRHNPALHARRSAPRQNTLSKLPGAATMHVMTTSSTISCMQHARRQRQARPGPWRSTCSAASRATTLPRLPRLGRARFARAHDELLPLLHQKSPDFCVTLL